MPPGQGEWISVKEASEIISKNSGHHVSPQQVRQKANTGHIRWKPDGTKKRGRYGEGTVRLYRKEDVEKVIVKKHGGMFAQTETEQVVTE